MHALDTQAFRLHATLMFLTETYGAVPVTANDTVKPIRLQIWETISQIVDADKHEEGVKDS